MELDVFQGITTMTVIEWIMCSVGYYFILKKCGGRPVLGIIPVVREYQISICADKESDGRRFAIVTALELVASLVVNLTSDNTVIHIIASIIHISLGLSALIYQFRIYNGLCQVFGRRKGWLWLWLFAEAVTSMIWGISKKFEPRKQIDIINKDAGVKDSGVTVKTVDDGLTVNIENRATIDFFKKKILLKDIHLRIPKGHMVLLLGGSGAGKTTFVNAVTGYEEAEASIVLNEQNIYKEYEKMKYDVGFVPQLDLMRGNDTVYRTLADAATLRLSSGVSAKQRKKRVHEVLEEFGLASIQHSLVEKLSGGQRKRLSIAMEFISNPTLFILDEPDSGLDGVLARGLFEKLRSIADSGKIVIVITHTPDRVVDLFDDVIVLAKDSSRIGRLAYYGPVDKAYDFFGKDSMEEILLSINQIDEGGEGRSDEFIEKYADKTLRIERKAE